MRTAALWRRTAFAAALPLLFASALFAAAMAPPQAAAPAPPQPSANKGKTGTYECKTSHAGYNYYVYVPKSYSDDNPAGLHLYFHGQGGGGGAPNFGQWSKHFLEPYNLIGINMQYTDGDNGKDTPGKVEAAIEAIRQTLTDYKILLGRGAVGSFSGGGLPHEMLMDKFKRGASGGPCPFNHVALYDSNYWGDPTGLPPASWFIGLGTKEWDMGKPTLGVTQTRKANQLFAAALTGGCADIYFRITKDKGHSISDEDVRESAAQFRRSDIAFAPFLYEEDYPEPQLAAIVRTANTLALGKAAASLDRLAADAKADGELKAKAAALKKKVDGRIEAALTLAKELGQDDPILCNYYANVFTLQLAAHPRAKELKETLAEARKRPEFAAAQPLFVPFVSALRSMFSGNTLAPGASKYLEDVKAKAGEKSLLGKMATEFLAM